MIERGKKNLLGVLVDAVDYDRAVERILVAARAGTPYSVTALAVHGVMEGVDDPEHLYRLNHIDLVTPDGQPVRWSLNLLHRTHLDDRVYGPELTSRVLAAAAREGLSVFFYGSRQEVLDQLVRNVEARFPGLRVAGAAPSMFRAATQDEMQRTVQAIRSSGADITFVGLGCPRQEVFVYERRDELRMPVLAVGAAFDYHAGLLREPPMWVQRKGLQWLYRLGQNPRRLWRRYLILNPRFVARVSAQRAGVRKFSTEGQPPATPVNVA